MRRLRQLCMTAALICAFAFSTFAGEVPCGGFASPPTTDTGNIECDGFQVTVSLIQTVLSLS